MKQSILAYAQLQALIPVLHRTDPLVSIIPNVRNNCSAHSCRNFQLVSKALISYHFTTVENWNMMSQWFLLSQPITFSQNNIICHNINTHKSHQVNFNGSTNSAAKVNSKSHCLLLLRSDRVSCSQLEVNLPHSLHLSNSQLRSER